MPGSNSSKRVGAATRTRKAAGKAANASRDSLNETRTSNRLAGRPPPEVDLDKIGKRNMDTVHESDEHSSEGEVSFDKESESGEESKEEQEVESQSEKEEGETSGSESVQSEEEELDPRKTAQDLKQIEHETRERISLLQKRLVEEQRSKKEAAKKKQAKLAALKTENAKRASIIEKLQQQEDDLFSQVQKLASKKKHRKSIKGSEPPSAHSTPKTAGEYSNLIRGLLNMSFNENDLMIQSGSGVRKLAPTKINEIRSILEHTMPDVQFPNCVTG